MSVKVMGAVFDLDIPPNLKLVLLAYADHAHHDGTSIFPAAELVAQKSGYSVRSVKRIARELESSGLLIPDGRGPRGTRRWRIPFEGGVILSPLENARGDSPGMGGAKSSAEGVSSDALGVSPVSPEPSLEPSLDPSENQGRFPKNDLTPLAQVKGILAREMAGDRSGFYSEPEKGGVFDLTYARLQMRHLGELDGEMIVNVSHPNPELISGDERIWRPLLRAFGEVLGPRVHVKVEEL